MAQIECDGFTGVGTNLEVLGFKTAVQHLQTVKRRRISDTVDFFDPLLYLIVQGFAIRGVVSGVGCLNGQLTNPLQVAVDLIQGPFSGLCQRDPIVGVTGCCFQTGDLGFKPCGNCQTRCVVSSRVDPETGRQTLKRLAVQILGTVQLVLRVD